jgi:outer membrane protein TolC
VTQLLYSDAARAGVDLSRLAIEAEQDERDELRLDAIQQASVAYLDVLRALTAERIQRDNLIATRAHLEFAQVRRRLGVAGEQEVLRWQSQLATNQRDVIVANAARNQAAIGLNRLLNRPLEDPIELADATLDGSGLMTTATRLDPFVNNLEAFRHFRNFMAAEALGASPELRRLDTAIRAQERLNVAARRSLWAPTISLTGDVTAIETGGVGSEFALEIPGFQPPQNGNVNWTATLAASLPLFTGGGRRAEVAEAAIRQRQLEFEREAAADAVEARVRVALHATGASFAAIQLTTEAAAAARRNLALVEDAYTRGAVPIIDLIDAQNASLATDQGAAGAVYDYLVDLMNMQRAVGRFDFFLSQADFEAFLQRLREFFERAGYDIGRRGRRRGGGP